MKFEMGDRVVCIKEYETLKVGSHYQIKGSGDLTMNAGTNKSGYGFMIEDENYAYLSGEKEWWKLPYEKIKWYYFTEKEMSEYFINSEEDFKSYIRNEKIKKIIS
jgi:hypothetical protein